ncbi:MAG: S41 family peptidase [Anaerovoracaceae bacterium]|jgi:carboxyl-terminal processing protease
MRPKAVKRIAAAIAIVVSVAMLVTSFSFIYYIGSDSGVVYGAVPQQQGQGEAGKSDFVSGELDFMKLVIDALQEYYKDEIDPKDLVEGAYQGIFDRLDPYSIYYNTEEERKRFEDEVEGVYDGIGINMEMVDGSCQIVTPLAGSPAERVGLLSGDIIKMVDGNSVSGLALSEISTRIRGPVGTSVTLVVERNGKEISFTLIREKIKTLSVEYRLIEGTTIGYIQIARFDSGTDKEFRNAKIMLMGEGAKSFIVDVRNNPGGLVNAAANIASQWMPKGAISHFERQGKIIDTLKAEGPGDPGAPLILLVNEGSASASEILAGAWQDSKTAKVVGTTTYGKGVAQTIFNLKNGHSMKLSIYYFLTPDKKVIDKKGITPDYYVSNRVGGDPEMLQEYIKFVPMSDSLKPKLGDRGLNVFGAQQRLNMLGHKVKISGTMDLETWEAIKEFQKERGLHPYGVLDYTTRDSLEKSASDLASGISSEDLQLKKAIELLK